MPNTWELKEVIEVLENEEYLNAISSEENNNNNKAFQVIEETIKKLTSILEYFYSKYNKKALQENVDIQMSWIHLYFETIVVKRKIESISIKDYIKGIAEKVKEILPTLEKFETKEV